MNKILLILLVLVSFPLLSQNFKPVFDVEIPNGAVNVIKDDTLNNCLYVGGSFNNTYKKRFNLVKCDTITGNTFFNMPNVYGGYVKKIVSDGNSGFFIIGTFTHVNDQVRNKIAKIDSLGNLTDWTIELNNQILDIEYYNNNIYLCGTFNYLSGFGNINKLIGLDVNTANVTFIPGFFDGALLDLSINNGKLYVSGDFNTYSVYSAQKIARFNLSNLQYESINISSINNSVLGHKIINDKIFIWGSFTNVNGNARNKVAVLDTNGFCLNWNPNPNGNVNDVIYTNNTFLIVGNFNIINSVSRKKIALYDSNFNLLPTIIDADGEVFSVIKSHNKLFFSGNFLNVNTIKKNSVFSIDTTTFTITNFNPDLWRINPYSNDVFSTLISNDKLILGGIIEGAKSTINRGIYKIDKTNFTNVLLNINIMGSVYDIAQKNDTLIVGGGFSLVNGVPCNNLFMWDLTNDSLINWFPNPDNVVTKIVLQNDTMYLIGNFSSILGQTRNRFSSINLNNLQLTTLNLSFNSAVYDLEFINDKILIVGDFTQVNSTIQNNITLIDKFTGFIIPTGISITGICYDLHKKGSKIYLAGYFNNLNSTTVSNFGILDINTLNIYSTNLLFSDGVVGIRDFGDSLLISGLAGLVNGNTFYGVLIYDPINQSFSIPNISVNVPRAFYYDQSNLFIGASRAAVHIGSEWIGSQSLNHLKYDTPLNINLTYQNCDSIILNNSIYYNSTIVIDTNDNFISTDTILTHNLIVFQNDLEINSTFSFPSSTTSCTGQLAITTVGNPNFEISIDGSTTFTSSGYSLQTNLCPGIYDVSVIDYCGDTVFNTAVISTDSNFVFNNPFIDSIAVDSLGATITNCDIYYNSIDTAFIDSLWATGNQVNVIWNIIDSSGSNLDTITYNLMSGNGVYWLQLSIFCPFKSIDENFTVTQAIYFENGTAHIVGLDEHNEQLNSFLLYPNPTTNSVTITYKSTVAAKVLLFDAQGKFIQERMIYSGGGIDLVELERGVYFVSLELDGKTQVKRIIKQ